jgi:hypothetical protein
MRPPSNATIARRLAALQETVDALSQPKPRPPSIKPDINGFCERHGISRSTYEKLRAEGLGPRESLIGTRVYISPEAEADFDRAAEERGAETPARRRLQRG